MKKIVYTSLFVFVSIISAFALPTESENSKKDSNISEVNVPKSSEISTLQAEGEDIFDMTINQNVNHPKVGVGQKKSIIDYQNKQAKELLEKGYSVAKTRQGEVLIATIPADKLFLPNDTLLRSSAQPILKPFTHFFKEEGLYKVLLVMYSDNTGSDSYLRKLTVARVDAIYDWLDAKSEHTELLVPYGLGKSDPLYPNNSMADRAKNRRLEIFLIPGDKMIKLAKENKLK